MILLFDTSQSELHIGIATDVGAIVDEYHGVATKDERGIHDSRLASETANLMRKNGVSRKEITRLGLIIGPGSFTGLRIGLAFAKGFCFGSDTAIVPITQHQVLARAANEMHLSADFFVTSGYQRDLLYVASADSIGSIELLTVATFEQSRNGRPFAGPATLPEAVRSLNGFMEREMGLGQMAAIAQDGEALTGLAISSLEPHYVTPFTPG